MDSAEIWQLLDTIKDPEIPVVSLVEMGMIRNVGLEGGRVVVSLAPTFIGCPAIHVMKAEIEERLREAGAAEVKVSVTLSPPWTTDWITTEARAKLKDFGLAPPPRLEGRSTNFEQVVPCPYCDSQDTILTNSFGPTLCRAIYTCNNCRQPFEQFKPI